MSAAPALKQVRRTVAPTVSRPSLRLLAQPKRRYGVIIYTLAVVMIILAGAGTVLWLNTQLAAGAFEMYNLENQLDGHLAQIEADQEQLAALTEPAALAAMARELGMVESHAIAYIVLSDGSIIGSAAVVQGDSSPQSYQSDQGGGQ